MTYTIATHKQTNQTFIMRFNPFYEVYKQPQFWINGKWECVELLNTYYNITGKLKVKLK